MIYINDNWNTWTNKSQNTPFLSSEKAIGDGEQKLGAEFNKKPLGQNFAYDLEINGERWEVKKLDSDNSFRLGVEVSTRYTPIIGKLIRILENVLSIRSELLVGDIGKLINSCISKIESTNSRCSTMLLDGLRKNEVAESNLDKANEIIEDLKSVLVISGGITLHSSIDGIKKDYKVLDGFKKIIIENISTEDKIKILGDNDIYNRLLITNLIFNDIEIFENNSLREELNKTIRNVFQNVKLVLVHEKKGFKPITDLEIIYCNRITSGLPRCKLV